MRGGSAYVDIVKFYIIIIKSANFDKGAGVNAYSQHVNKNTFFKPFHKQSRLEIFWVW